MQSRYYDPEIGRFINADAFASTGQGILGHNMYAYCLNNPVNFIDTDGRNTEALQGWVAGMAWLPFADTFLPVGDIIYAFGIIAVGSIALATSHEITQEVVFDEPSVNTGPHPPNNNDEDDDEDDDYYDNDSNFGGRQKMGTNRGNTPRNNQSQNKQFKDATKGLSKGKMRQIHDLITKQGFGYEDVAEIARWFK